MVANGRARDLVGCWQGWKSSLSSKRSSGGRECTANNERMPPKSYSLQSFSERFFPGYPKGALQGPVNCRTSGLEVPRLLRKVASNRLKWPNWTRVVELDSNGRTGISNQTHRCTDTSLFRFFEQKRRSDGHDSIGIQHELVWASLVCSYEAATFYWFLFCFTLTPWLQKIVLFFVLIYVLVIFKSFLLLASY